MRSSFQRSGRQNTASKTPPRREYDTHCLRCHGGPGTTHQGHHPQTGRYQSPGAPLRRSPSGSPRRASRSPNATRLMDTSSRYLRQPSGQRSSNVHHSNHISYQEMPVPDMATDRHAREATLRAQEKFEGQIEDLENDKIGLIKRLNMVLVEHDNAVREKERLQNRLNQLLGNLDSYQRKLDQQSNLKNVLSKNLQEDLNYEHEMGDKLKDEIKSLEFQADRLQSKLRDGDRLQNDINDESNNLNYNLKRKEDELQALENDYQDTQNKKRLLQEQLDRAQNSLLHAEDKAQDLKRQLQDVAGQREGLVYRMSSMTNDYEGFFVNSQKLKDKQEKDRFLQTQRQCAHKIFQTLDIALGVSKAMGFLAIRNKAIHDRVDNKCFGRMVKAFSRYEKRSRRFYIRLWHKNALDWHRAHHQKFNLANNLDQKYIKRKMFSAWLNLFHSVHKKYDNRLESCKVLKSMVDKNGKMKMRSCFNFWKNKLQGQNFQVDLMKNVFKLHYKKTLKRAMIKWLGYAHHITHQVRLEELSELWSRTKWLQALFLGWKEGIAVQHRQKEEATFKAWKQFCGDNLQEKYVTRMSAMTNNVEKMKKKVILKKYFDSLRHHVKQQNFGNIFAQLVQKERPRMQQIQQEAKMFSDLDQRKKMTNVFRTLLKNFSNSLYSYFMQWKLEVGRHNDMMKRVKMLIIRHYKSQLNEGFVRWKRRGDLTRFYDMSILVEQGGEDALARQKEVFSIQHMLDDDDKREEIMRGKKGGDILRKFGLTILRHRFNLWHFNIRRGQALGDAAFKICGKLRKRMLREHFAKYKNKVDRLKREERLKQKLGNRLMGMDSRIKERAYEGFKIHHQMCRRAKKYFLRVFDKGDKKMLQKGMNSWKAAMVALSESRFLDEQRRLEDEIERLKAEEDLTNASILESRRKADFLNESMQRMGQRTMMKYLNLLLNKQLADGFYRWKDATKEYLRHRSIMNKYMLKLINHFQIGAFGKWKDFNSAERKKEHMKRKKELQQELRHLQEMKDRDDLRNQEEINRLNMSMTSLAQDGDRLSRRYNNALKIITSRAADNDFVDRRKMIFDCWRHVNRKEREGLNKLFSNIQKSHRTNFFKKLTDLASKDEAEQHQHKTLQRFFFRFMNNLKRQAFSEWRSSIMVHMSVELNMSIENFNQEKQAHRAYKEKQKEVNMVKFGRQTENKRKRNILLEFKKMCDFIRLLKNKKIALQGTLTKMRKKNFLNNLAGRTILSNQQKFKTNRALKHLRNRSLFQLFSAWHDQFIRETVLPRKLKSALSRTFLKDKSYVVNLLKDFAISKGDVHRKIKFEGAKKFADLLNMHHQEQVKKAFEQIRYKLLSWDQQVALKKGIFLRGMRRRLKQAFEVWKHKLEQVTIIQQINRESHVASDAYRSRNNVVNMKKMLVDEGYHPDELDREVFDRKKQLEKVMERAVLKLKMQADEETWPAPKALEAWKWYTHIRKNIKYYADYCARKMNSGGQLKRCFLHWKLYRINQQLPLESMPKQQLVSIVMNNERNINIQKNHMDQQDDYLSDLNMQKLALFNRCLSGRKLGLTLSREKFDEAKLKAFHKWKQLLHEEDIFHTTLNIKQKTVLLEKKKEQYQTLEDENNELIEDNEQLRQASLDGIEIAKAVQELTKQREQLSVDLADRATSLKKLMEDNENLRQKYEQKRQEVKRITDLLYGSSNHQGALPGGASYNDGVVHPDLMGSGYSTAQIHHPEQVEQ